MKTQQGKPGGVELIARRILVWTEWRGVSLVPYASFERATW
jgi:hypothetical protein